MKSINQSAIIESKTIMIIYSVPKIQNPTYFFTDSGNPQNQNVMNFIIEYNKQYIVFIIRFLQSSQEKKQENHKKYIGVNV